MRHMTVNNMCLDYFLLCSFGERRSALSLLSSSAYATYMTSHLLTAKVKRCCSAVHLSLYVCWTYNAVHVLQSKAEHHLSPRLQLKSREKRKATNKLHPRLVLLIFTRARKTRSAVPAACGESLEPKRVDVNRLCWAVQGVILLLHI